MCSTFQINGAYCETIGDLRAAVGNENLAYFLGTMGEEESDIYCLCGADIDRMCEVYQEIDAPDHVDFAFVDKAKLGGGE